MNDNESEDLDGEELTDSDMPGLVDDDGQPVLRPVLDDDSISEQSDEYDDDASDNEELGEDAVEDDGVAAATSI